MKRRYLLASHAVVTHDLAALERNVQAAVMTQLVKAEPTHEKRRPKAALLRRQARLRTAP